MAAVLLQRPNKRRRGDYAWRCMLQIIVNNKGRTNNRKLAVYGILIIHHRIIMLSHSDFRFFFVWQNIGRFFVGRPACYSSHALFQRENATDLYLQKTCRVLPVLRQIQHCALFKPQNVHADIPNNW